MTLPPSPIRRPGWIEKSLWMCALLCSGVCAVSLLAHESAPSGAGSPTAVERAYTAKRRPAAAGAGALSIPALQLTVPVLTGCSFLNLERGACHMEGSANFGGLGNAAVAGHRDKDFRPLERLRKGMDILVSEGGQPQFRYVVDTFEIVSPEDVRVLDIHERPELTLITCYPFHYVGSAPKRFIVHAHLVLTG